MSYENRVMSFGNKKSKQPLSLSGSSFVVVVVVNKCLKVTLKINKFSIVSWNTYFLTKKKKIIYINDSLVCMHKFIVIMCAFLDTYIFEKWATYQLWVRISFNPRAKSMLNIDFMMDKSTYIQTKSYLANLNICSITLMSQLDFSF